MKLLKNNQQEFQRQVWQRSKGMEVRLIINPLRWGLFQVDVQRLQSVEVLVPSLEKFQNFQLNLI